MRKMILSFTLLFLTTFAFSSDDALFGKAMLLKQQALNKESKFGKYTERPSYKKYIQILRELAKHKHSEATYILARDRLGEHCKNEEGIKLLEQASHLENKEAIKFLAQIYLNTMNTRCTDFKKYKNIKKGRELIKKNMHIHPEFKMIYAQSLAHQKPLNYKLSYETYFEFVKNDKNPLIDRQFSLLGMGVISEKVNNFKNAFNIYNLPLVQNYGHTNHRLAEMYLKGNYVKKDIDKAVQHYKKAGIYEKVLKLLLENKKYEECVHNYSGLQYSYQKTYGVNITASKCYIKLNELKKASQIIQGILSKNSDDEQALKLFAQYKLYNF